MISATTTIAPPKAPKENDAIKIRTIPVVREILGRVRDLGAAGNLRDLADLLVRFYRQAWEEGWIEGEIAASQKHKRPAKARRSNTKTAAA